MTPWLPVLCSRVTPYLPRQYTSTVNDFGCSSWKDPRYMCYTESISIQASPFGNTPINGFMKQPLGVNEILYHCLMLLWWLCHCYEAVCHPPTTCCIHIHTLSMVSCTPKLQEHLVPGKINIVPGNSWRHHLLHSREVLHHSFQIIQFYWQKSCIHNHKVYHSVYGGQPSGKHKYWSCSYKVLTNHLIKLSSF